MIQVDRLRELIKNRFDGNQAAFARAIERSPSQVNQWLSGHRKLDDKGCRHIERALNLTPDYMIGAPATSLPAKEPTPQDTYITGKNVLPMPTDTPLRKELAALIDNLSDRGLILLIEAAEQIAARHPRVKANPAS